VAMAQSDCDVTASAVVTNPTCGSSDGVIDITPAGGLAPYYFTWNTGSTDEDLTGVSAGSYWVIVEDWNKCLYKLDVEVTCDEPVNCQFRTQTQGGWGATPNGNNPAKYLQNNFANCFPNGITIGCASGNTLTLTSSNAVKNFLPAGSTPGQLTGDLVNPLSSPAGVLAGQLVAATINITFDACDPNFGASSEWLGNAYYVGGPFDGYGVFDVIFLANQYIGGCGGSFTAAEFNEALTDLNENYVGGTIDNGNFDCGKKEEEKSMSTGAALDRTVVFPNPVADVLTLDLTSATAGSTQVTIADLSGRTVVPATLLATEAGENRKVTMNVAELSNGTYLLIMKRDGNTVTRSFVVAR